MNAIEKVRKIREAARGFGPSCDYYTLTEPEAAALLTDESRIPTSLWEKLALDAHALLCISRENRDEGWEEDREDLLRLFDRAAILGREVGK